MSKALKSALVPALKAAGFVGAFPRFRRSSGEQIQFVSVQYHWAQTAFFLEFGSHPAGPKLTSWGELVPEDKLILEHVQVDYRARLQAQVGRGSVLEDWFQFGSFGQDFAAYTELATGIAALFPQIEAWFSTQQQGPNVYRMGL